MILSQKKAFLDGLTSVATDWIVFNFAGIEPSKESEFPFDISNLDSFIENCQSATLASSSMKDEKYIKFLHEEVLLNQKGMNPAGNGIILSNIVSDINISPLDKLSLMNGTGNSEVLPNLGVSSFIEFHLGGTLEVDKFVIKFSANNWSIHDYNIEYWDGNLWVLASSHSGATSDVVEHTLMQTTSKIRLIATSNSYGGSVDFDLLRIIGTGDGEIISDVSTTWSVLIPKDYSIFNSVLGGTIPFLYCKSTGPNAGGDVILTNANPNKGEDVRLLNFSVKAETVEF